ncbi:phage protein GemA/Gp16 family protein [uncultured Rikenella sp.]|uniref:phage protein GemA/Gp16 family protein n=1 Tax=uncultured Rikenella sp. TaxID=368003 RepID=UPI002620EEEC|nr:phage protein GemA/Gp16 family protein [uncultured Rikenella sp.]
MITNSQKRRIHTLISELGWSRTEYVTWLKARFGVDSCVLLQIATATRAIDELEDILEANRAEFRATEKPISYIKYLWIGVDYAACTEGDKLLNTFLRRRYQVNTVDELTRSQASGAISAIKRMQASKEKNKGKVTIGRASIDPATGKTRAWVTLEDGSRIPVDLNCNQIQ